MSRAPAATYRVQLHRGFDFAAAAARADYLSWLGVSHLYCSPVLQAVPGSQHGYDVVDHGRINLDLGGAEGFDALVTALSGFGLGTVLDIVPNHMATAGRANAWWWDVLENGPASPFAGHFDIDWDPPEVKLRQRVLVPILGDHYGKVLQRGELQVRRDGGSFVVSYFDHELPVSPRTLDEVMAEAAGHAQGGSALMDLARGFASLPPASATDRRSVEERHRRKGVLYDQLDAICRSRPEAASAVAAALEALNADADRLDALLGRQNYRLAYWRVAGQELDYRRFFDIPGLIALRVEQERVFSDSHSLVGSLARSGRVDGLRIDHPDGLRDPVAYLEALADLTGGCWVAVEKILEDDEELPSDWKAAGTTGYEFLNLTGGLFVDPAGELPLTDLYRRFTGDEAAFAETALVAKHEIMRTSLATDVERLTAVMAECAELRPALRDYTRSEFRGCLREILAAMSVYRTYVRGPGRCRPEDRALIEEAVETAKSRRPDLDGELFEAVGHLLAGGGRAPVDTELAQRFQQLSGPVMAKGVEDTAFYRYNRLICLNEVGGNPARFGSGPEAFHDHNHRVQRSWPLTLLASSTHDTKRSEDVRARLALLSEIPDEWARAVERWAAWADRYRTQGRPGPRTDYLLFQTLLGAHPLDPERAQDFLLKASREAKLDTSWTEPDADFEAALSAYVDGLLADPEFRADLEDLAAALVVPGRVNSLAAVALKLTCPGVPDIYQGTEVWDLSLVDPDNRRPVDYSRLEELRHQVDRLEEPPALDPEDAGRPKLWLIQRLLDLRRERPEVFGAGSSYEPLWAAGPRSQHAVAFSRGGRVVTIVPRLVLGLQRAGGWGETVLNLPPGRWTDRLGGTAASGAVSLGDLLESFPVAVLVRD